MAATSSSSSRGPRSPAVTSGQHRSDELQCVERPPLPAGTLSVHDGVVVVRGHDSTVDLTRDDGTPLYVGARRFAFEGNTIYALAVDGTVRFRSREELSEDPDL